MTEGWGGGFLMVIEGVVSLEGVCGWLDVGWMVDGRWMDEI